MHTWRHVSPGYPSLPVYGRASRACQVAEQFGADLCVYVPGLSMQTHSTRRWLSLAGAAAPQPCPACEQGQLEEARRFNPHCEPLWPFLGRRPA
jgi:hypothetical protein